MLQFGTTTTVYDPGYGWHYPVKTFHVGTFTGILSFIVPAILSAALFSIVVVLHREGFLPTLRRVFSTGMFPRAHRQAYRRAPRSQKERFAAITSIVQGLPTEIFHSKSDLEKLSVGELKELIGDGTAAPEYQHSRHFWKEKTDLVDAAIQRAGGSSATSCGICCEEYASGDVLRALKCSHRFHLECVDKWFLSSATDYSRPVACPMCNAIVSQ